MAVFMGNRYVGKPDGRRSRQGLDTCSLERRRPLWGHAGSQHDMQDGRLTNFQITGPRRHRHRQNQAGPPHHALPRIRPARPSYKYSGKIGCVSDRRRILSSLLLPFTSIEQGWVYGRSWNERRYSCRHRYPFPFFLYLPVSGRTTVLIARPLGFEVVAW